MHRTLVRGLSVAALIAALCLPYFAGATQSFQSAGAEEGLPVTLPDGRLAILGAVDGRAAVLRIAALGDPGDTDAVDLEVGDMIVAWNELESPSLDQLRSALAAGQPGDPVSLAIERAGERRELRIPHPPRSFMVPPSALRGAHGAEAEQERGWTMESADPRPPAVDAARELRDLLSEAARMSGAGVTAAVALDGEPVLVEAYGLADVEAGLPMTPDTRVGIASVTKQFTAFAVALLAERGRLDLGDDAQGLLPELPDSDPPIRIRDLLQHTSGLKDYTGLLSLTGWEFGDALSPDELTLLVDRQRELDFTPGASHRYSNTNYALLPVLVERATGVPFADWMKREVFEPIGLDDTALPADRDGRNGPAGDGGLVSTPSDLLRWAEHLARPSFGQQAVRMLQEPARLADGETAPYGLGLGVNRFRGLRRLAHSGGAPGVTSVLHVYPDDGLAVAVVANSGETDVYAIAERAAELWLGDRLTAEGGGSGLPEGAFMITREMMAGEGLPEGVEVDPARLADFDGRYAMADDHTLLVELDGDRLRLKLRDDLMPGVPLVPLGEDRFLFTPAHWEITFHPARADGADLTVHLSDRSIHRGDAREVTGRRVESRILTADELAALTGRYASPELGVVYELFLRDGALVLEHPRLGRLPLTHLDGLHFGVEGRNVTRVQFLPGPDATAVDRMLVEAYAWGATATFHRLATGVLR